jgi:hypothetical protein
MKLHEETSALGAFGFAGLAVFSFVIYFGFGVHLVGTLFGVVTILFGGLIATLARTQRSKQ